MENYTSVVPFRKYLKLAFFNSSCALQEMVNTGNVPHGKPPLIKDLPFFCFSKDAQAALKIDMVHACKRLSLYEYFS
jgi:hypothetical protein